MIPLTVRRLADLLDDPYSITADEVRWLVCTIGDPRPAFKTERNALAIAKAEITTLKRLLRCAPQQSQIDRLETELALEQRRHPSGQNRLVVVG